MDIDTVLALIQGELLQGRPGDTEIRGVYTSDLLSDVMAHAEAGDALVTIQAHKNTLAVATLVNSPLVIICNKRPVQDDMLAVAEEEDIAIIRTSLNQYEVSGRLYQGFAGA